MDLVLASALGLCSEDFLNKQPSLLERVVQTNATHLFCYLVFTNSEGETKTLAHDVCHSRSRFEKSDLLHSVRRLIVQARSSDAINVFTGRTPSSFCSCVQPEIIIKWMKASEEEDSELEPLSIEKYDCARLLLSPRCIEATSMTLMTSCYRFLADLEKIAVTEAKHEAQDQKTYFLKLPPREQSNSSLKSSLEYIWASRSLRTRIHEYQGHGTEGSCVAQTIQLGLQSSTDSFWMAVLCADSKELQKGRAQDRAKRLAQQTVIPSCLEVLALARLKLIKPQQLLSTLQAKLNATRKTKTPLWQNVSLLCADLCMFMLLDKNKHFENLILPYLMICAKAAVQMLKHMPLNMINTRQMCECWFILCVSVASAVPVEGLHSAWLQTIWEICRRIYSTPTRTIPGKSRALLHLIPLLENGKNSGCYQLDSNALFLSGFRELLTKTAVSTARGEHSRLVVTEAATASGSKEDTTSSHPSRRSPVETAPVASRASFVGVGAKGDSPKKEQQNDSSWMCCLFGCR